jgi:hypothetical protein
LLEFLFGGAEGVWGRVEFVGFKALVREPDIEWLVIFLQASLVRTEKMGDKLTCGTLAGSVCDEAASVVTSRR